MIGACIAMVLIIFVMSFMFFRSGRKDYGLAIIPLVSVPSAHAVANVLTSYLVQSIAGLSGKYSLIYIGIDVTALIIGAVLLGVTAKNIQSTKNRNLFLTLSILFLIIIAWVLIIDVLNNSQSVL